MYFKWNMPDKIPEKSGWYLTTCDGAICGEDKPFVTISEFIDGKWSDDEEVIAWMDLPKPYSVPKEPLYKNRQSCGNCGWYKSRKIDGKIRSFGECTVKPRVVNTIDYESGGQVLHTKINYIIKERCCKGCKRWKEREGDNYA